MAHHLAPDAGHDIRLPPYHCDLNPMEMVWGMGSAEDVGQRNISGKLADTERLPCEIQPQTGGGVNAAGTFRNWSSGTGATSAEF